MPRRSHRDLLLGEWACLGVLYPGRAHGFAVAARLKPDGDIGRVWSLSRALTYRALEQLRAQDLICDVGQEPGIAGGDRTVLAATRAGRAHLRTWLRRPVVHLRDLRSELLLKLVLAEYCNIDVTAMLEQQRAVVDQLGKALAAHADRGGRDVVGLWRRESSVAALRFLDQLVG